MGALVALALAGLVAVLATRPPASAVGADSPLLGQPAPAIAGPALAGGNVSLASMRGDFVLVNFFAGWCPPCASEAPQLRLLSTRIRVLGVVFNDSASSARDFLARSGSSWPAVADPGGALALDYGVRAPPESYLVSPDGTVVAKILGPVGPAQVAYLDRVMQRTLQAGQ